MGIATHNPVCKEICDALGLKNARKFVLTMEIDSIVTVDVEYFPEIDGMKQIRRSLAKYKLVPREEGEYGGDGGKTPPPVHIVNERDLPEFKPENKA